MDNKFTINVYSEIGKLKSVILHSPGEELSNIIPNNLQKLLFEDIPDLNIAKKEHENFANLLIKNGVEVLYIEQLICETLENDLDLKKSFLNQFLIESKVEHQYFKVLKDFLLSLETQNMVNKMIAGIGKYELNIIDNSQDFLLLDPMPNFLFQRDPFTTIGNGININKMHGSARTRETLFHELLFKKHLRFKENINFWYHRNELNNIEGGDIMILNKYNLIIGSSQRTSMKAIRKCAKNLLKDKSNSYEKVIVIDIKKKSRDFMHLDTILTNVDYDKFLVHALIFDNPEEFKIIEITAKGSNMVNENLKTYLSKILSREVKFIKCGGDNPIAQAREQWNDGSNVFTIEPGVVIAYDRNHVTNKELRKAGITVHEFSSSELSRGRGGPRCMSMPIWREDI